MTLEKYEAKLQNEINSLNFAMTTLQGLLDVSLQRERDLVNKLYENELKEAICNLDSIRSDIQKKLDLWRKE